MAVPQAMADSQVTVDSRRTADSPGTRGLRDNRVSRAPEACPGLPHLFDMADSQDRVTANRRGPCIQDSGFPTAEADSRKTGLRIGLSMVIVREAVIAIEIATADTVIGLQGRTAGRIRDGRGTCTRTRM
jgi:hypothetical protein